MQSTHPYGDGNHASNLCKMHITPDAAHPPRGDGNVHTSASAKRAIASMQPAPLTGTATCKCNRYAGRFARRDAIRAPYVDGNLNARKNRKIGITDATRAPHGDGNIQQEIASQ